MNSKSGTCHRAISAILFAQIALEILIFLNANPGKIYSSEELKKILSKRLKTSIFTVTSGYKKKSPFQNPASYVGGVAAELARHVETGVIQTTKRCPVSGRYKAAAFYVSNPTSYNSVMQMTKNQNFFVDVD